MAVRTDLSFNMALSPRVVRVLAPSTEIVVQDIVDTLQEVQEEPVYLQDDNMISAAGKEDLGGGVSVGITATLLNTCIAFDARKASISSGTISDTDVTGEFLIDSGADFVGDGVVPGCWVVNLTDGSICSVLAVSTTTLTTDYLGDGIDNNFFSGDLYKVWPVIEMDVRGGNLVAVDEFSASMSPVLPTAGTQVSLAASSSGTLLQIDAMEAKITLVEKIMRNEMTSDETTGVVTIYDDDGVTPLVAANIYKDKEQLEPWDGTSEIASRERFE